MWMAAFASSPWMEVVNIGSLGVASGRSGIMMEPDCWCRNHALASLHGCGFWSWCGVDKEEGLRMAVIDPDTLERVANYRLLIGAVVPRPIAWITTVDAHGTVNLAPFSFFNGVTASPPTLMVSIGHRPQPKDTLANLRANGQAVVHLVPDALVAECHQSGGEYAPEVSETDVLGLALEPSLVVRPPRLQAADVAFECTLDQEVAVGDPPASVVFLRIVRAHIRDDLLQADGLPDPERVRALSRLGDRAYLRGSAWEVVHQEKQHVPEAQRRR
ncbi:MAG: flavin reductase family protein [Planctomycetota bacterium]|nr:MAG: flavin reductase family protein [Planctomycetota bacterium]